MQWSSLDDVGARTQGAFGDERLESSPGRVVVLDSTAAGDDKGIPLSKNCPLGSASGCEKRRMVHSNMKDLVSRAWLPVLDNGVSVLCFAEYGLLDCLTSIELEKA